MSLKHNPHIPEGINASEENPLKEFFILLAGIGVVFFLFVVVVSVAVQHLSPLIPFKWEQQLTQSFSSDSDTEETPDATTFAAEQALRELVRTLSPHVQADTDINYTVHLIEQATPNAFATLGGHIFVTSGLLSTVSSENGLAMVVAHEMAHIKHRHPIQSLSRGAILQLLLALVGSTQNAGAIQQVLGQTGLLTVLSFNRDMEREADDDAISTLRSHYGHINGANQFFVTMYQQSDSKQFTEWLETHPATESRIDKIRKAGNLDTSPNNRLLPLDPRLVAYIEKAGE